MALIRCNSCGNEISDKAAFCPHCGAKAGNGAKGTGTLTFKWKGAWMAADTDIHISVNGQNVGREQTYSFKKGFTEQMPISSGNTLIRISVGRMVSDDRIMCSFEEGKNYTCTFHYNRVIGAFTYEIANEEGYVVYNKGYSTKRKVVTIVGLVLLAVLVLCNIVYYLNKDTTRYDTTRETADSVTTVAESPYVNEEEESTAAKTKYVYEFTISTDLSGHAMTARLSLDTEEGTAQLTTNTMDAYGRMTSEKATFYGSCERYYDNPDVIQTGGFSGADDYDVHIKGERLFWAVAQYLDTKNNYLYIDSDSYKAKNPDYRLKLTPIE